MIWGEGYTLETSLMIIGSYFGGAVPSWSLPCAIRVDVPSLVHSHWPIWWIDLHWRGILRHLLCIMEGLWPHLDFAIFGGMSPSLGNIVHVAQLL